MIMKAEEIRELTLAGPTKPFTLHLADGRTINVETRATGKPHFVDAALITGITGIGEEPEP